MWAMGSGAEVPWKEDAIPRGLHFLPYFVGMTGSMGGVRHAVPTCLAKHPTFLVRSNHCQQKQEPNI